MSSSCMGKELPKEKKWGVKDCRARKCPELRKNENTAYPEDGQERCQVFNTMPGTLSCCIKDLGNQDPREFLRHALWSLLSKREKDDPARKKPGKKNCPEKCPYKISKIGTIPGNSTNGYKSREGTVCSCAFTGDILGLGMSGLCYCHVLDIPDQEQQIAALDEAIELHQPGTRCAGICPDGIKRAETMTGEGCPVCKVPIKDITVCPLWRIPAKLLPAQVAKIPEKSETPSADPVESTQKEKKPSRKSSPKEKKKEVMEAAPPIRLTTSTQQVTLFNDPVEEKTVKKPKAVKPEFTPFIQKKIEETRALRDQIFGPDTGFFPDEDMIVLGLNRLQEWYKQKAPSPASFEDYPSCSHCVNMGNCPNPHPACDGCDSFDECESHDPKKANCVSKCLNYFSDCKKARLKGQAEDPEALVPCSGPEIPGVCNECEVLDKCTRRDPHAGCHVEMNEEITKKSLEEAKGDCPDICKKCAITDCEVFDSLSPECLLFHPDARGKRKAACEVAKKSPEQPLQKAGGPTPGACGTCGHHKGRKTFHSSCPRLGELLFKGGTKSAKVLMEETQRDRCEHWVTKEEWAAGNEPEGNPPCDQFDRCTFSDRDRCENILKTTKKVKCLAPVRPKKDTPEWFAALTEAKRRNNPGWLWEVWKHDPAKGEWLYEGTETEAEANALKAQIEETKPAGSKVEFIVKQRPVPDYPLNDIEGPCKVCKIECIDENGADGCWEFEEHSRKLDGDGEPPSPRWGYRKICIISCGKAKIWDEPKKGKKVTPVLVPAREAYTGPLFTLARKYAEHEFEGDEYYILSDKYGLIRPGEEIENYDVSPEDIEGDDEFIDMVQQRAKADPDLAMVKKITVVCGKIHQRIIERAFRGVEIINPVQGLPQGKRMQALKQLIEQEEWHGEFPRTGSCNNCQNSAVNVIMDSCPRLKKGVLADDLYEQTEAKPCEFWGEREGPGGTWLMGKKPALARSEGPYEPDQKLKKPARKSKKKEDPQP